MFLTSVFFLSDQAFKRSRCDHRLPCHSVTPLVVVLTIHDGLGGGYRREGREKGFLFVITNKHLLTLFLRLVVVVIDVIYSINNP